MCKKEPSNSKVVGKTLSWLKNNNSFEWHKSKMKVEE